MKQRKGGIALITTMMVMVLLVTLTGAFFTVSQASSRLGGNSVQRRIAQDACLTGMNLVWRELEKDRRWGQVNDPGFSNISHFLPATVTPKVSITKVRDSSGFSIYRGKIHPSGQFDNPEAASFEFKIYNNLVTGGGGNVDGSPSKPRKHQTLNGLRVPSYSVRIIGKASCGTCVRNIDSILRQKPLSYDSLRAGRSARVGVQAGGLLRISSRDLYANQISAGRDLVLPDANHLRFLKHGEATSEQALNLGSLNLADGSTTDEQIRNANELAGGTFSPRGEVPRTPAFDKDVFKLPGTVTEVADGVYRFGGIERVQYRPQTISYSEYIPPPPGSTGPGSYDTGSCHRAQRITSVYDRLIDAEGRVWVSSAARTGSEVADPPTVPTAPLGSEGAAASWGYDPGQPATWEAGSSPTTPEPTSDVHEIYPGMWANVVTGQIAVRSGFMLNADGPGGFIVEAAGAREPEVLFGYRFEGSVAVQESLSAGLEAAKESPETHMAGLEASQSISVPGGFLGYGSVIAGGDVTLKASSGLRAAPDLGVVVKARSLTINPATEPEPTLPGEPVSIDYPTFREGISTYAGGDWSPFETWLTDTSAHRSAITANLKTTRLGSPASTYWNQLNTELATSIPFPTLVGDWSGNLTLEQYVRLKEFIQTKAAGYHNGEGDLTWLDMSQRIGESAARVENTVGSFCQWAKSYKQTLQAYLASPTPDVPEMFYQGLLYADQDLTVNANGKAFRLEGSLMASGNTNINDARNVDLVYDRSLVDDQMNSNATGTQVVLEKVFFTIY